MKPLSCDVLVVGSGAGGSTVAYALARAGAKVLVVEKGPYHTLADFERHFGDGVSRGPGGDLQRRGHPVERIIPRGGIVGVSHEGQHMFRIGGSLNGVVGVVGQSLANVSFDHREPTYAPVVHEGKLLALEWVAIEVGDRETRRSGPDMRQEAMTHRHRRQVQEIVVVPRRSG